MQLDSSELTIELPLSVKFYCGDQMISIVDRGFKLILVALSDPHGIIFAFRASQHVLNSVFPKTMTCPFDKITYRDITLHKEITIWEAQHNV